MGLARRKGEVGGGGGRQRGRMGMERHFAWGDGHMMQCVDDHTASFLLSCILETCRFCKLMLPL